MRLRGMVRSRGSVGTRGEWGGGRSADVGTEGLIGSVGMGTDSLTWGSDGCTAGCGGLVVVTVAGSVEGPVRKTGGADGQVGSSAASLSLVEARERLGPSGTDERSVRVEGPAPPAKRRLELGGPGIGGRMARPCGSVVRLDRESSSLPSSSLATEMPGSADSNCPGMGWRVDGCTFGELDRVADLVVIRVIIGVAVLVSERPRWGSPDGSSSVERAPSEPE